MELESKEYSWKFITADECLSHRACELCCTYQVPNKPNSEVDIYDGENTNGDRITRVETSSQCCLSFCPKEPVYCRRGLYINIIKGTLGIFVQWRELGHKGGES